MAPVIDWQSETSHLLLNPARRFAPLGLEALPDLKGHIWLATSGTSARHEELKLVALSKRAFLASAAAVNAHLEAGKSDSWLLALPEYHVGGLSIYARAALSSSVISRWRGIDGKWNVRRFHRDLCESGCTLVSMVPTQIWDLIKLQLPAPAFLRAALIGGGDMSPAHYDSARRLGWPILPTYGFTECCSQIATAPLTSLSKSELPRLRVLSHVRLRTSMDGRLEVKSPSLLTGQAIITEGKINYDDPKVAGWFQTPDIADLAGDNLVFRGRSDDFVKICGENVSQLSLQSTLEKTLLKLGRLEEGCIALLPDDRRGHCVGLVMVTKSGKLLDKVAAEFNQEVLPYEKILATYQVPYIPRTELGKAKASELLKMLTQRPASVTPTQRSRASRI